MAGRDSSSVPRSLPPFVGLSVLAGSSLVLLLPWAVPAWGIGVMSIVALGLVVTISLHGALPSQGARYAAWLWPTLLAAAVTAMVINAELETRWPSALNGERVIGTLEIDSLIEGRGEVLEFDGTLQIESPDSLRRSMRVQVRWAQPPRPLPAAGEQWRVLLRLSPPVPSRNPGGFDVSRQALAERWHARAQVLPWRATQRIQVAKPGLLTLRAAIAEKIFEQVVDRDAAALFAGLAVGATQSVSVEQWRVFSVTGTTHLVAISGMHVTLFAWLMAGAARRVWRGSSTLMQRMDREVFAGTLGVCAALGYALLAGFEVPTQRTVVMLATWWGMRLSGRAHSDFAILGLAVVAVWLIDPLAPLSAGFWLSFVAMATLMTRSQTQTQSPSPSQAVGTVAGLWSATRELWRVQWRIGIALLPLTLAWFSTVSIAGLVVNLLAIPVFSFVLVPLVLLGSVLQAVWLPLAQPCWWLAEQLHAIIWPPMHTIAQSEWASWSLELPMSALLVAMGLIVVWLFVPRLLSLRLIALALFGLMILIWPPRVPVGALDVTVLDGGDATAVILRTRTQTLVYDTAESFGSAGGGARGRVIPALRALRAGPVDLLVLGSVNGLRIIGAATLAGLWPVKEIRHAEGWQAPPMGARRCDRPMIWQRDNVEFQLRPAGEGGQLCLLKAAPLQGPSILIAERLDRAAASLLLRQSSEWLRADVVVAPRRGSLRALDRDFAHATGATSVLVSARLLTPDATASVARAWGVPRQQVYATANAGALSLRLQRGESVQIEGYQTVWRLGAWRVAAD